MTISFKQGAKGRWRWMVHSGAKNRAVCMPYGFDTREEAEADAREVFQDVIYLETTERLKSAQSRTFR